MNIKEHDCVVLTADLPADGLLAGDVGTVIHIHKGGVAFEVEFVTLTGRTIAVATVEASQLRPVSQEDINHVRRLIPAWFLLWEFHFRRRAEAVGGVLISTRRRASISRPARTE